MKLFSVSNKSISCLYIRVKLIMVIEKTKIPKLKKYPTARDELSQLLYLSQNLIQIKNNMRTKLFHVICKQKYKLLTKEITNIFIISPQTKK